MVWVVLLASAAAVLLVGVVATLAIIGRLGSLPPAPPTFWPRLAVACALTILSLAIRSLRWIFLLRRAETRIPIRDAYIGYFAGFSLLFVPLLVGEVVARSVVLQQRGRVPPMTTAVVNVWERVLDLLALGAIAAAVSAFESTMAVWHWLVVAAIALSMIRPLRRAAMSALVALIRPVVSFLGQTPPGGFERLAQSRTWTTALLVSVAAWFLPGAGLFVLAGAWAPGLTLESSAQTYAASAFLSGVSFAPAGILVAGTSMLSTLGQYGFDGSAAVFTVFFVRLATVGVSTALGLVFAGLHLRSAAADSAAHFDDIADAYDVQIPEGRRHALLDRKTALMRDVIGARGIGRRGLDVGCGQGAYVARMRTLGFDVAGIDASAGQVALAGRNVGDPALVSVGSVLSIPAPDASYDFLYIINVLHHLSSIEEQRRAFAELFRVLKPGGLLFVHEINTTNVLFRFYMGYVFPSLNCIDEGIERWLLPAELSRYTDEAVLETRYFTFLPDFVPQFLVGLAAPFERMLESSRFGRYSAHYMAVLQKDAEAARA